MNVNLTELIVLEICKYLNLLLFVSIFLFKFLIKIHLLLLIMSLSIYTNFGILKFELFCEDCPLTCRNFLSLAASGYYSNTKFHRLIHSFLIQGGDPSSVNDYNCGKYGISIYNSYFFNDEINSKFKFSKRGLLASALKGNKPNTNSSQFFITFGPAQHLNNLNTIFGQLIAGEETLNIIEAQKVDNQYKPTDPIIIEKIVIHSNPFAETAEI